MSPFEQFPSRLNATGSDLAGSSSSFYPVYPVPPVKRSFVFSILSGSYSRSSAFIRVHLRLFLDAALVRCLIPIQLGRVNSFLTESFDRLGLVYPVNPVHPVKCSSLVSFSPALLHWSFIFAFIRVHSRPSSNSPLSKGEVLISLHGELSAGFAFAVLSAFESLWLSFLSVFIRVHSRLIFCSRVHSRPVFCSRVHSRPILISHPQVTT